MSQHGVEAISKAFFWTIRLPVIWCKNRKNEFPIDLSSTRIKPPKYTLTEEIKNLNMVKYVFDYQTSQNWRNFLKLPVYQDFNAWNITNDFSTDNFCCASSKMLWIVIQMKKLTLVFWKLIWNIKEITTVCVFWHSLLVGIAERYVPAE